MAAGERHGFGVTLVDAFRDEGAEVVSSSRIRALLCEGEVAEAAGLLGYRFTVESEVIGGQRLGRTLGFPTANMRLSPEATLKEGIYAVRFRRADGTLHDGVASFGRRPTVDDKARRLKPVFFPVISMARPRVLLRLPALESNSTADALVMQTARRSRGRRCFRRQAAFAARRRRRVLSSFQCQRPQ